MALHHFPPGPGFPSRSNPIPLSCAVCHMYSYNPDVFIGSDKCSKCTVFAVLEARLSELEAGLNQGRLPVGTGCRFAPPTPLAGDANHKQTRTQNGHDGWATVAGRKRSKKQKHTGHAPLHVSNKFSPLAAAPVECVSEVLTPLGDRLPKPVTPITTLVIGSSIMRNVKFPGTLVKCIPGARAGDIESNLKMMANSNGKRYDKIVIHCGGNDTRRRRSEITKINVESVCTFAKTMSDTVIFSGPLPSMNNDEMYSRMSSFNRWLSRWCPDNNVGFINHWQTFEGKSGLMGRDCIHPTWDGAKLISKNMETFITNL